MENLIYALFIIMSAFSVGAAAFGAWAQAKLITLRDTRRQRRRHAYAMAATAGYAATGGILLEVVIGNGSVGLSWETWAYTVALGVSGVGFAGLTRQSTDELAAVEEEKDRQGERFVDLENRVTAEESRNTDIEELARAHKAGTEPHASESHAAEEEER